MTLQKQKTLDKVKKTLDSICYKKCRDSPGMRKIKALIKRADEWRAASGRDENAYWRGVFLDSAQEERDKEDDFRIYYGL